ncbi:hypothetical protein EIP91_005722 [Steccherinum ochraceum]|uniref:Uncharacterized protein n=1 Tax=Steccherinum ochraceum TaxID=92696 RepID=A0A4R0RZF0_9APHY|nr:hypothetical protein EIP91_005722 [Steccherinum ochraceum]
MSTRVAPQVTRGEITLQPSYFTSSLYVHPLREDISQLIHTFAERYLQGDKEQPFALFKTIWREQGWVWLHFKVFDGRSRERFIGVTLRSFAERTADTEDPIARVVALFGMYTFFSTQPSTSLPPVHSLPHIAIPIDILRTMTTIPDFLTDSTLSPLRPYATHILTKLLDEQIFHILPESSLLAQNPAVLPREVFIRDDVDPATLFGQSSAGEPSDVMGTLATKPPAKKKGRPSKRDKAKKAKDAVVGLDRWLEKSTFAYPDFPIPEPEASTESRTTHTLIAHPPVATRSSYAVQKTELLDKLSLGDTGHPPGDVSNVVARANEAVLTRLRRIDEMAAEKGLEVGGEGGDMTGLSRVDKAVEELREGKSTGGILNLLEGAGSRLGDQAAPPLPTENV